MSVWFNKLILGKECAINITAYWQWDIVTLLTIKHNKICFFPQVFYLKEPFIINNKIIHELIHPNTFYPDFRDDVDVKTLFVKPSPPESILFVFLVLPIYSVCKPAKTKHHVP